MHVLMFYTVLHKIYAICSSLYKYLNSSVMKALERVFGHLFSLVFCPGWQARTNGFPWFCSGIKHLIFTDISSGKPDASDT